MDNVTAKVSVAESSYVTKHSRLNAAIGEVDSVIYRAEQLLARVTGNLKDSNQKTDVYEPALCEFLERAPDLLYEKNNELRAILDDIEEALF